MFLWDALFLWLFKNAKGSEEVADTAHYQTDLKLEEMEKRLSAIYSRAEKEIQKTADEYFSKFAKQDEAKKKLVEAGKLTEEEYAKWRKGKVMYGKRFTEMKEQCAKQLLNVNQTALAYVNGELPEVYALNYNALAGSVDGVGGYSFTLVDADTVRNLAVTDTSLLPYKELDPAKDIPWNMKKINAETLQGILQGESMDKIAKRIMNVQEMNKESAIRSARTIVTNAECKGRQDSYQRAQDDGIILRKYWLATYDKRARDWHKDAGNDYTEDKAIEIDDFFIVDGEKMLHPGDAMHGASGHNLYNCRCSVASKVIGFKKAQVQKAMAEKQVEEPKITTREQAYKTLTDDIGFGSVSDNVSAIDEKLLTENVTQLKKLNDRFGALTADNNGYFTATSAPRAVAYSQGNFRNLNNQSMSLCGNSYGRGYDFLVAKERDFVYTNWSMPCLDKNLPIYTVTHEYGHIFENKVIRGRVDMDVFEQAYKAKMLEKNGAKKAMDFLKKEEAKQAKTIWQEITQIAKEENPDFLVSKNISEYGKTNYFEAFAETFANSQCGSPNELGKAMNIWLERNGY